MARTLLVADDSPTIRRVVELTFADTDIRVEAVADGCAALEALERLEPDIVLADVGMQEPSGYEICERVKRSARPVPVLLLAGTFEPLDLERARACGADGHLVKPFDATQLRERVEAVLAETARGVAPAPAPQSSDPVEAVLEELASVEVAPEAGEPSSAAEGEPAARQAGPEGDAAPPAEFDDATVEALARAVVERLSLDVLREIAWDVVPQVAERVIRERIRELERELDAEDSGSG